jgi:hypothetical protein
MNNASSVLSSRATTVFNPHEKPLFLPMEERKKINANEIFFFDIKFNILLQKHIFTLWVMK